MHTSNKKHREWEELVRETGCCITGATNDVQIHHVVGRKGKHNKILIGPYFILPLHEDYHMVTGANPNAWHKNKKGFIEEFGCPVKLFKLVCHKIYDPMTMDQMEDDGPHDVLTSDIAEAILDYRI